MATGRKTNRGQKSVTKEHNKVSNSRRQTKRNIKNAEANYDSKITAKAKELEKLKNNKSEWKRRQNLKLEAFDKVQGKSDTTLLTGEEINATPTIKSMVDSGEVKLAFSPNEGPQTAFLAASEKEVLYGGAAGGGKSYAMLMDPLRYMHRPRHSALLLRRSMGELMELIDISRQLYPLAFKGAKYKEAEKRWVFPSGATLRFGYLERDPDVYRYQGLQFSWIGIDEITQYPTPFAWDYLRSRLRTTDPEITTYMRCTANPGGVGGWWVKKMFIDPSEDNTAFWARDLETDATLCYPNIEQVDEELRGKPLFKRKFIPAKLTDNKYLMQNPEYLAMLASLPETQRKRLLEGDWDVADDCAFPEFNKNYHVINPYDYPEQFPDGQPPSGWKRFKMCDYGYVAYTGVLWCAVDYSGNLYIYKELYQKGLDAESLAYAIKDAEVDEPRDIAGVLDAQCWENKGTMSKSIADTMIEIGIKWQKAPKGPGSRLNGKAAIHRLLRISPETEEVGLRILTHCPNLIRTLPMLPLDPNKPEDVDTNFEEDHLYDALRYGLTSPHVSSAVHPNERAMQRHRHRYKPLSQTFGY